MHAIRLREPWERESLADGAICFTRRFHCPTGLDAANRVWLVIDDVAGAGVVTLNDRVLGNIVPHQTTAPGSNATPCPARFDITSDLCPSNLLSIQAIEPSNEMTRLLNSVRLEIE
jgi:hypothetical protein